MKPGGIVIAFGILWAAYAIGFTGYVWLRGYDLSFREIVAPVHYYTGDWPPPKAPATKVVP